MSNSKPSGTENQVRQRLLELGYHIIPNRFKIPAVVGWNTPEYLARELSDGPKGRACDRVKSWEARFPDALTTGLRIEDGLCVIDVDVEDQRFIKDLIDEIEEINKNIGETAPFRMRDGSFKIAIFVRLAVDCEPFVRLASRRYQGQCVEIFGGKKLKGDRCSRQFGIYGPHSDGAAYEWPAPGLDEINIADLPEISREQIYTILDAADALAKARGWSADAGPADNADVVYDITEATRFDTNTGGVQISYAELCDEYAMHGDALRCSANFMAGRGSEKTTRCLVGNANRHRVVAVFVPGDEVLHFPDNADGSTAISKVGALIKDLAQSQGVVPPIKVPNWRERYANLMPKGSFHNTELAIDALGIHCSKDTFHNRLFMGRGDIGDVPLLNFMGEVTDGSIGLLRDHLSDTFGVDFTEKNVRDVVNIKCLQNSFDPVADMLAEAEKNWDGKPRLDCMAVDYLNAEDTPLNRAMVRKTMIAAVARVRRPGCKFDTILTMESDEGWNKSSAWLVLAGEENFSDVSILGHSGREVQEHLAPVWIHENAELAGMKKADTDAVKAFASRQVDIARPAYGRFTVHQPRHSIEVGTTNSLRYLQSMTGNRRFWPIRILAPIDLSKLKAARLQLWGEAAHWQTLGESLTLDESLWQEAAKQQERRRVRHPWEAMIHRMLVVPKSGAFSASVGYGKMVLHEIGDEYRVHTSDIFEHVFELRGYQMHSGHGRTLSDIMQMKGWVHKDNIRIEGKQGAGYVISTTKWNPGVDDDEYFR